MLQERNPVQQGQRGCKARRRDRSSQCRTGWGYFPTASPPTPQTKWTIILEVVERERYHFKLARERVFVSHWYSFWVLWWSIEHTASCFTIFCRIFLPPTVGNFLRRTAPP
jgi:hypothetical protein